MTLRQQESLTSDEENEILDYYDENLEKLGTISRKKGIDKKLLLESVQLWIINPKSNQVLMQKRSINRKNDAGKIDVSTSGHVKSGETPIHAMLREAEEEIGIRPEDLGSILKNLGIEMVDLTKVGRKGNYFVHEYMAYMDKPLNYFKFDENEIEKLFFMDYEKVKQTIRNNDKKIRIPSGNEIEKIFAKIDEILYYKGEKEEQCEEK